MNIITNSLELEPITDSIRNKDGLWINTSVFREDALHFKKYGYYTADPWGSPAWFDFWNDRRRRIIDGYEVGGARITGDHYFYLNFCPIMKTEDTSKKKSKKVRDFGDFWDGDYNYFWAREIARDGIVDALRKEEEFDTFCTVHVEDIKQLEQQKKYFESLHLDIKIEPNYLKGGYNLIVGKSRRKGYSFKNAAVGVKNYITRPESLTIYGAYEKKFLYPKGIFTMATNYLDFINDNTAWGMPSDYINTREHKKASYKEYKNGIEIEKGFKSEMMALTFKDNPDAARGKDAFDIIFEESGAFGTPGLLKDSYSASEDCTKDGEIKTGLITIFGTSGDMESGTRDYAEMFNNPARFSLLPMNNVWEDEPALKEGKCGFFHPVHWNMPGFYDEQGNSDQESARAAVEAELQRLIDNGATSTDISKKLQEKPRKPSEAFAYTAVNIYPTKELARQKNLVTAQNLFKLKAQPVSLVRNPETKRIEVIPDMAGKLQPITGLDIEGSQEGAVVIYERPIPNAPRGLYRIGYDPVRQDEGTSLAAIIVYKGTMLGSATKDCIVAEYVGRMETNDDIHYIAEMLAELYNTQIMYENEVPDVKTYFTRRHKLHLLALQPDNVISKNIKKSGTNRVYGCHMTPQLKDAGERYIKQWLLSKIDFDEEGNPIYAMDKIISLRLLDELLNYNKKGNFDLHSALIMCMFQVQEEVLGKEYDDKPTTNTASKLLERFQNSKTGKNLGKSLNRKAVLSR